MLSKLEDALNGTRRSIREVCDELDMEIPAYLDIESCSNCGIWGKNHQEQDGLPICSFCYDLETLRF